MDEHSEMTQTALTLGGNRERSSMASKYYRSQFRHRRAKKVCTMEETLENTTLEIRQGYHNQVTET